MSISLQHTKAQKMLFCFLYPHCRSLSFWAALCTSGCGFGAFFTQLICDLWGRRTAAHPARRPKFSPLSPHQFAFWGGAPCASTAPPAHSALLHPYIRHRQVPSKGEQKGKEEKRKKEKERKNLLPVHMACMHPCNALLGVPNNSNGSIFAPICDLRVWGGGEGGAHYHPPFQAMIWAIARPFLFP